MLLGLWLRACDIGSHQQQRTIHDGGARQHRGHENVVTGAIHERHVADQVHDLLASGALGAILLVAAIGTVTIRLRTLGALVDLGVGVTQSDGDVLHFLLLESDGAVRV